MEKIKGATYFCTMLFLGLIIGGAIKGNTAAWVSGLILLLVDIGVGISIHYLIDKQQRKTTWSELSEDEKKLFQQEPNKKTNAELQRKGVNVEKVAKNALNDIEQEKNLDYYDADFGIEKNGKQHIQSVVKNTNGSEKCEKNTNDGIDECFSKEDLRIIADIFKNCSMQNKFDYIYKDLKDNGGARIVSGIDCEEEAASFILDMCKTMPHAPLVSTLSTLSGIFADQVGEHNALVYAFRYSPNSMCQNVFIFLVNTENEIRFFVVETDLFCGFCLCEYADGVHRNYGAVKLENIPTRINEIIGA